VQNSLLSSDPDIKTQAAEAYYDLINFTDKSALKLQVLKIAGPLIRVVVERVSIEVKITLLKAIELMLTKAEMGMKTFAPQLQSTLLKCINDPTSADLRDIGSRNLARLLKLSARIDPVIVDCANSLKNTDLPQEVVETVLKIVELSLKNHSKLIKQPASYSKLMGVLEARIYGNFLKMDGCLGLGIECITLAALKGLADEDFAEYVRGLSVDDFTSELIISARVGCLIKIIQLGGESKLSAHKDALLGAVMRSVEDVTVAQEFSAALYEALVSVEDYNELMVEIFGKALTSMASLVPEAKSDPEVANELLKGFAVLPDGYAIIDPASAKEIVLQLMSLYQGIGADQVSSVHFEMAIQKIFDYDAQGSVLLDSFNVDAEIKTFVRNLLD